MDVTPLYPEDIEEIETALPEESQRRWAKYGVASGFGEMPLGLTPEDWECYALEVSASVRKERQLRIDEIDDHISRARLGKTQEEAQRGQIAYIKEISTQLSELPEEMRQAFTGALES